MRAPLGRPNRGRPGRRTAAYYTEPRSTAQSDCRRRQPKETPMPYESLRPYLDRLTQQGLMRWIDKEVDKDWEISAIGRMIFRGMAEERRYGFGFRNIKGCPGGRVVSGVVAASTKMMAVALDCEPTPAAIHAR